jgi:hypothetical protein
MEPEAQPAPVEPDWKAEYLKSVESGCITLDELREARAELAVIKQALAAQQEHEPENEPYVSLASVQEPVAWMFDCGNGGRMYAEDLDASVGWLPLYTAPPAAQRQWVGLTDEEENALIPDPDGSAEANVRRVEVLPGAWGKEYEEVDAWSKPLVLQMLRDHEAKLKEKNNG